MGADAEDVVCVSDVGLVPYSTRVYDSSGRASQVSGVYQFWRQLGLTPEVWRCLANRVNTKGASKWSPCPK